MNQKRSFSRKNASGSRFTPSWESNENCRYFRLGRELGINLGHTLGFDAGYEKGFAEGSTLGYNNGFLSALHLQEEEFQPDERLTVENAVSLLKKMVDTKTLAIALSGAGKREALQILSSLGIPVETAGENENK